MTQVEPGRIFEVIASHEEFDNLSEQFLNRAGLTLDDAFPNGRVTNAEHVGLLIEGISTMDTYFGDLTHEGKRIASSYKDGKEAFSRANHAYLETLVYALELPQLDLSIFVREVAAERNVPVLWVPRRFSPESIQDQDVLRKVFGVRIFPVELRMLASTS